jgi:hypothetical protein
MKKIGLILLVITTNLAAQQNRLVGKVKSVRDELINLNMKITKTQCDSFSNYISSYDHYELGWAHTKVFDSIFNHEWKTNSTTYRNFQTNYNPKGLKSEETMYNQNNVVHLKYEYRYNELDSLIYVKRSDSEGNARIDQYSYQDGLLLSHCSTGLFNETQFSFKDSTSNSYNDKRQLIQVNNYENKKPLNSLTYIYNDKSQPKELFITEIPTLHPADEAPKETTRPKRAWRYNEENELLEEIEFYQFIEVNNSITATDTIEAKDCHGRINGVFVNTQLDNKILSVKNDLYKATWHSNNPDTIQIDYFDYDFKTRESFKVGMTVIQHNERNQETSRNISYNGNKQLYITEYDSQNRISKYKVDQGYAAGIEEYEYFYQNNLLTKVEIKGWNSVKTITFSYKFDAKGNWTEQTKSVDSKPLFVLKRNIEYYN